MPVGCHLAGPSDFPYPRIELKYDAYGFTVMIDANTNRVLGVVDKD